MSNKIDSREVFEQMLVAKIWKDPQFKAAVKANSKATIASFLKEREPDAKLPDVEITVVEETADQIYMAIPVEIETPKTEITAEDKKGLTRKQLEAIIAARAAANPAYKAELQANPKSKLQAILQELEPQLVLPDNLTVNLLMETSEQVFLVVPQDPTELTETDLTEEQLEKVAGGVTLVVALVVGAVTVAVGVQTAGAVNVTAAININEAVNVHHVANATKGAEQSPW